MRNEAIAATSSGVETVSVLDQKALADLASGSVATATIA